MKRPAILIRTSAPRCSLVWFRLDLRLGDNPALAAAARRGAPVVPFFLWSPDGPARRQPGGASRWWLHHALVALDRSLRRIGSRLVVRRGPARRELSALIRETGADALFWNQAFDPPGRRTERAVASLLRDAGVAGHAFNATLLHAPDEVCNQQRLPYQVFTAYWRACQKLREPDRPLPAPRRLVAPRTWPASLAVAALRLRPRIDWAAGLRGAGWPGEAGAHAQLRRFCRRARHHYSTGRDRPAEPGTSRLSPHLHFGEIGPRQVWHALRRRSHPPGSAAAIDAFRRELGWREFAHQLLYHFPRTVDRPLRPAFERFPWRAAPGALRAWQRGRTGYPAVDAGMRELWSTGWMHNRVRMIAGSFLVKHLLVDWRRGAAWFWDTLVDADLANNTLGWQWVAGCGADAAPYFRIFNPVLQGRKFDPRGDYVRRWVPELARLEPSWIHQPWAASPDVLAAAGIELGRDYPRPIVEHAFARQRALAVLRAARRHGAG
ncbi:MAG: deoxyribodipyrimidine photo-lyase [Phycisphaerae bacterium]